MSARRAAGVEPVSSAARTASPGMQRLQRREVLLGERLGRRHEHRLHVVLDGAQDRVQRDDGLARADLAHQQALHRPRRGELRVERGDRRALVAGQRERQQLLAPAPRQRRRRRRAPAPRPTRGAGRGGAAARAGRAAARRTPAGGGRPRGRRRARRRAPRRRSGRPRAPRARAAGSGSTACSAAGEVRAHEREDLRRGQALGRRVVRDLARAARRSSVGAWLVTRNALRAAYLPCRTSRVPGGYLRCSQGWLKNVAFITPVSSATVASTSGFIPRRRTGPARDRAHLDDDRRDLAGRQRRDRARLAAVARQVLEQVADRHAGRAARRPRRTSAA